MSREAHGIRPLVPVFEARDMPILDGIARLLLADMLPDVGDALAGVPARFPGLTPVRHGVEPAELANALWHHVFGFINEELIGCGMIAAPEKIPGEGRYLKALYVEP